MLRSMVFRLLQPLMKALLGTRLAVAVRRIPGAQALLVRLMREIRPSEVEVRGHQLLLDPIDSMMLSVNGSYETAELDLFRACVKPGGTVIDVGAHIGLYTLEAARAVGPQGTVVAFEPASENYALLQQNVARNGYRNVRCVNAAVADVAGDGFLSLSAANTGDHRLGSVETEAAERVRTVTLDGYLAEQDLPPVSVVKMDIQGAEPAAIAGAQGLLSGSTELALFTEFSPGHLEAFGGAQRFLSLVDGVGLELFQVDPSTGAVDPVPLDLVDSAPRDDAQEQHVNLVGVKGSLTRSRVVHGDWP